VHFLCNLVSTFIDTCKANVSPLKDGHCLRTDWRYFLRRHLGTWNVRSLYRAGSLTAAARKLTRYKLDLMGVQEVRWDKKGTVEAGDYSFFYGNGN
jgi:hypothetical protein